MGEGELDFKFLPAGGKTNETLKPTGLYITHLFQEDQIILTPDWLKKVTGNQARTNP